MYLCIFFPFLLSASHEQQHKKKLRTISCRCFSLELCLPPCENRPLGKKKISCQCSKWLSLSIHMIARPSSFLSAKTVLLFICQASCIERKMGFLHTVFIASHSSPPIPLRTFSPPSLLDMIACCLASFHLGYFAVSSCICV